MKYTLAILALVHGTEALSLSESSKLFSSLTEESGKSPICTNPSKQCLHDGMGNNTCYAKMANGGCPPGTSLDAQEEEEETAICTNPSFPCLHDNLGDNTCHAKHANGSCPQGTSLESVCQHWCMMDATERKACTKEHSDANRAQRKASIAEFRKEYKAAWAAKKTEIRAMKKADRRAAWKAAKAMNKTKRNAFRADQKKI